MDSSNLVPPGAPPQFYTQLAAQQLPFSTPRILDQPCSLLDWGFFSTNGDPAFDAAVAAGIFNMYGSQAAETDRNLCIAIEDVLAYEPSSLLIYRAAYAVATSNVYDVAGNDGHFAWCVANLRRPDLRRALEASR